MKNIYYLLFFIFTTSQAQTNICDVQNLQKSIDSIHTVAKNLGFTLVREASISMDTQYEVPVIAEVDSKKIYKLFFIGQPDAKLLELRIYDQSENQLSYIKKNPIFSDPSVIVADWIPIKTELNMMRFLQVYNNKKIKKGCGYIALFEYTKKEN